MSAPLLIEIGCEEIPARMLPGAADELATRLTAILDDAGFAHGPTVQWGGPRRLAVRVDAVAARQPDRVEQVLGPPVSAAFKPDGTATPAATGFARKQGIDASALQRVETDRGIYVGFSRDVAGKTVGEVLAAALPASVASMTFPKTMRWGRGTHRWVRPVHWLVALHGSDVLPVELFGVAAERRTRGHRFLSSTPVELSHAERYVEALRAAYVLVAPADRRRLLGERLDHEAAAAGGAVVRDDALLDEVADLVEWPGVVTGRFDAAFLDLPEEILVTTLRHHQKAFSVQAEGRLLPLFLSVANTDRDPSGHVRRGNEWVVSGRLEDARFFWRDDRQIPLVGREERLRGVMFHAKLGSYVDKEQRVEQLAFALAQRVGLDAAAIEHCRRAAALCKHDLVTGTVGEFPELQGQVGGLLLRQEGQPEPVAMAVYHHHRPASANDSIPPTTEGAVVALADKLDTMAELIKAGELPTGSRDPFGLRRTTIGIFRIIAERRWPLSLGYLWQQTGSHRAVLDFLAERLQKFLRERGFTQSEVNAVFLPEQTESFEWELNDSLARLEALRSIRDRADFAHLVDLTKRVDNIIMKNTDVEALAGDAGALAHYQPDDAESALQRLLSDHASALQTESQQKHYAEVIELLSQFIKPVDRFFAEVLVIDRERPGATYFRYKLLVELKGVLVRYFDIRELAHQADRSA